LFYKIDLHGMTTHEAKRELDIEMNHLDKSVREVEVVHGYRQGSALMTFVRNYKHPKIKQKVLSMNQGITIFVINNS
jgi:DNA-nicking Smr family endonuclease